MSGEAAASAARAAGKPGKRHDSGAQENRSRDKGPWSDEALWRLAASQQAASAAQGRARGSSGGTPVSPVAGRDSYRPWFAGDAGSDIWLSAEHTADPWFTKDE